MSLLTVLSYNVHECVGLDRRRDPGRIARVILASGAQIVGLQEVHSESDGGDELHQANYLAAATGMRVVPGPTLQRRNGHYGNLLLTSGRVRSVRKLDLSVARREPRGAIDADVEIDGEVIRVIVTHFGLSWTERRFQAGSLLEALNRKRAPMEVLLADFNEWLPAGRPLRWFRARFGKSKTVRTFPTAFPLFALDRIWASPSSALVEMGAVRDCLSRIASDHLPLKATLQIPRLLPADGSK